MSTLETGGKSGSHDAEDAKDYPDESSWREQPGISDTDLSDIHSRAVALDARADAVAQREWSLRCQADELRYQAVEYRSAGMESDYSTCTEGAEVLGERASDMRQEWEARSAESRSLLREGNKRLVEEGRIDAIMTHQGIRVHDSRCDGDLRRAMEGARLYRVLEAGKGRGVEGQYWALEPPDRPGYQEGHGISDTNFRGANVVVYGRLAPDARAIAAPSEAWDGQPGGRTEIIVEPGGVKLEGVVIAGDETPEHWNR